MVKITKKQIKDLKESIGKMAKAEEAFLFMLFKNEDGTDNVTEYCENMPKEKLGYFLRKAINHGTIKKRK